MNFISNTFEYIDHDSFFSYLLRLLPNPDEKETFESSILGHGLRKTNVTYEKAARSGRAGAEPCTCLNQFFWFFVSRVDWFRHGSTPAFFPVCDVTYF